jgi:4-hydroxy-tetrahydrodipicolinate reductase
MGRALIRAAAEVPGVSIAAAVASPNNTAIGRDAGEVADGDAIGIRVSGDLAAALSEADVAIDFSSPEATAHNLAACCSAGKALLVGTTGFPSDMRVAFQHAATQIPLLVAPNTSIGVTLLIELVRQAARALPPQFDIEIIESHHRMKRDAPSGTALALGRAAAEGRDQLFAGQPFVGQEGGRGGRLREDGEIGFAIARGGDIIGEHEVLFAGLGENLSLSHRVTDRAIFARGALRAAAWLAPRPAGEYFMRDLVTYKSGS